MNELTIKEKHQKLVKLQNENFLIESKSKIRISDYVKQKKISTVDLISFLKYISSFYKNMNSRVPIELFNWIDEKKIFDQSKKKREIEKIVKREKNDNKAEIIMKYKKYNNYIFIKFHYRYKDFPKKDVDRMLEIVLNRSFNKYLREKGHITN